MTGGVKTSPKPPDIPSECLRKLSQNLGKHTEPG